MAASDHDEFAGMPPIDILFATGKGVTVWSSLAREQVEALMVSVSATSAVPTVKVDVLFADGSTIHLSGVEHAAAAQLAVDVAHHLVVPSGARSRDWCWELDYTTSSSGVRSLSVAALRGTYPPPSHPEG